MAEARSSRIRSAPKQPFPPATVAGKNRSDTSLLLLAFPGFFAEQNHAPFQEGKAATTLSYETPRGSGEYISIPASPL